MINEGFFSRTGMVDVDDTALHVTDSGGAGTPIVYLNGAYADSRHWNRVIADLGDDGWRHITYDERARGRSAESQDYSFAACLRDLDAVLRATGAERPLLAGWSYGATLAMHWAHRNPDRTLGVVAVDGAMPYDWIDDAARARLRSLFHRLRWVLPVASRIGLAARMTAEQHAEVNIEANELLGTLEPILESLGCPVRYVIATGAHLGTSDQEMQQVRASLDPALRRNPRLRVSATVDRNHAKILRRDSRAVADAIRETAVAAGTTLPTTTAGNPDPGSGAATDPGGGATISTLEPGRTFESPFHSQGVMTRAATRLAFVSGQVGVRPDGSTGQGVREQTAIAIDNIRRVLGEGGLALADVVSLRIHLTAEDQIADFVAAAGPRFTDPRPAATLLLVPTLSDSALSVQIEAIAAG